MKTLTQSQYASYCNKSQGYISKLIKRGMPTVGKNRQIDPVKADEWCLKNVNATDAEGTGKPEEKENTVSIDKMKEVINEAGLQTFKSLSEAQKFKETYLGALRELEYKKEKGLLIDADGVRRDAEKAARIVKERVTAWPGRTAPLLAAITDEFECEQILIKECNQLLEEISQEFKRAANESL